MHVLAWLLTLCLVAGCGNGTRSTKRQSSSGGARVVDVDNPAAHVDSGTAQVAGSVATMQIASANSVFFAPITVSSGTLVILYISDAVDACDLYSNGLKPSSANMLLANIYKINATGDAFAVPDVGTYQINGLDPNATAAEAAGARVALAEVVQNDANCQLTLTDAQSEATAGDITVTSLDDQSFAGTFNVTTDSSSNTLSGSFAATYCPAIGDIATEVVTATCHQ